MHLHKLFPLLITLLIYAPSLNGQTSSILATDGAFSINDSEYTVQRTYDTDDGLPANGITTVIQDKKGYIWASTFNGLVRYNGHSFRVYDMDSVEGLTSNRFLTVTEGSDGHIYAGLEFGSLLIIEDENMEVYHLDQDQFGANVSFNAIYEDDSGRLWIGTATGLFYFENGQFIRAESDVFDGLDSLITQMIYRFNDDIYILFINSIVKFDTSADEFSILAYVDAGDQSLRYLDNFKTASGEIIGEFWQVYQKADLEFILIHEEGIIELTDSGIKTLLNRNQIQSQIVNGMYEFNDRTYVYGSDGLFSTDNLYSSSPDFIRHSEISISYMTSDHEGGLWIASHAYGLIYMKETPVYGGDNFAPVSDVPVTAIMESSDGTLYVGTNCDALHAFQSGEHKRLGSEYGINNRCVWSLLEQSDGTIWLGTWGEGAFKKAPDSEYFEPFHPEEMSNVIAVLSLFEDSKGNIWLGSYSNGLYMFDGENVLQIMNDNGQVMSAVRMLFEDDNGQIYVASDRGIGRLNSDFKIEKPDAFKLTRTLNFRTIIKDGQNRFWFGSYGGGIVIVDGDQIFTMTRDHGLYDNTVSQLNFDSTGNLWLGGNLGVFLIEREQIELFLNGKTDQVRVSRIGEDEGLMVKETTGGFTPSSYMNEAGELFIPTVRGMIQIDTFRHQMNRVIPKIYLEEVEVDGQIYMPDEFKRFSHRDRRLIFRFSILSYKNPEYVEFEYLLDGYDEQWQRVSEAREVVYTSLPPGQYILRIRGSNNDGFWNEEGVSYSFTVAPPFWGTIWFYLIVILLIASIAFLIYRYRVARIEQLNLELEKEVEKRTLELKSANEELKQLVDEKNKMQRVLGHDLRNPLAGIIGYLDLLKNDDNVSKNEEHEMIIETLMDSSRNTMNLLENLIHFSGATDSGLKPMFEKRNIKDLAKEAIKVIEVQAAQKEIDLVLECDNNVPIEAEVDANMILSVFRNLISNAVKYSPVGKKIIINIFEPDSAEEVYIRVIDQGVGMDNDQIKKLFSKSDGVSQRGTLGEKGMGIGLQICKDFVHKHNGIIEVESQRNSGSIFTVKLPKKQL